MDKSLYELRMEYGRELFKHWRTQEIFTFQWYFNIAMIILFYIVWIKLVDKRRLKDLLLFGSFVAVAAVYIDIVAVTMGLWEYKIRLFPLSPAAFPFDLTIIPILYMFVLQYTTTWRSYLVGSILASSIFSFIIEPLYVFLGLKEHHNFNYFYMFVLVFLVTTIIKFIYNWINRIQQKHI